MFIFLIAAGCELKYVPILTPGAEVGTGLLAEPSGVELACTSNTGDKQTLAQYDVVQCPRNNQDEDEDEDEDEYEVPSTEEPMDLDEHDDNDDDDDVHRTPSNNLGIPRTPSDLSRVREFNDEFTQALLRSTFNTFHSCAEVGIIGVVSSLKIKNQSVLRRQKRAFWLAFGPPGVAIGLVISKF